jgi:hypothetical protein
VIKTLAITAMLASVVSILTTLALTAALQPSGATAQTSRVRAEEFSFVGSDGTDRVVIQETNFGGGVVRVLQGEAARIILTVANRDPESTAINLNDTEGQRRIWLALKQGTASGATGDLTGIAFLDDEQRIRLHVGLEGNGAPFIRMFDEDGNRVQMVD